MITKYTARSTHGCAPKKGQIWCVKDRHADGAPVHQHFKLENRAKTLENQLRAERVGGERVTRRQRRRTVRELGEEWRLTIGGKDTDNARYCLARVYRIVGDRDVSTIDGITVQATQQQLLAAYSRNSVEVSMSYFKRLLRRAHADGLIAIDPTFEVRMPRRDALDTNGKVTAEQVPTVAEALAIISGAPLRYRAGVALGLGCGLRVGEVLGLTPSRVDLGAGQVTIDRQFQRGILDSPKTWRGVRTIAVPDVVLTELHRTIRPGMAPDMPILEGARGGMLRRDDFYGRAWRPALIAAGLDRDRYKFHSARHFAVSSMLGRGVSPIEVAAYVGDAPETILSTYAHFLRDSPSVAKLALDFTLAGSIAEALRDNSATSS